MERNGLRMAGRVSGGVCRRLGFRFSLRSTSTGEVGARMPSFGFSSDTFYETFSISPSLLRETEGGSTTIGIDYADDRVDADTNFDVLMAPAADFPAVRLFRPVALSWMSGYGTDRPAWSRLALRVHMDGGTVLNRVSENEWAGSLGLVRKFDWETGLTEVPVGSTVIRRPMRYLCSSPLIPLIPTCFPRPVKRLSWGLGEWKSLTFGGRVFRQWMRDEIIYDSSSFANMNLDRTRRVGLDFSLQWLVSQGLSAGMHYE